MPPFIQVPRHVDRKALFAAAERLEQRLHARIGELDAALSELRTPGLSDDYWPLWIRRKLDNVLSYLQIYVYIIGQALPEGRPLRDLHMLDYGGGWGLLGLLAKEAGVGRVTYLDIEPGVSRAVKVVSDTINLPLEDVICADENALYGYPAKFDAVVSSDCLEHVYDPRSVFAAIASVCKPGALVFHHTGANPYSAHQRLTLTKIHREEEAKVLLERKAIILERVPEPDASRLAAATRGLNRADLERAIEAFIAHGTIPTPDHPTNTCYLSGYWLERLMDPYAVAQMMAECGYRAEVRQSFWGPGRSSLPVRAVKNGLNMISRLSVPLGLRATFYYGIRGERA